MTNLSANPRPMEIWEEPSRMAALENANLQAERDHYVAFAFCWADALVELGADQTIAFAAGAFGPLVGCAPEELIGVKFDGLVAGGVVDVEPLGLRCWS